MPRSPKGRAAARGFDARLSLQHAFLPAGDASLKTAQLIKMPVDSNHGIYRVRLCPPAFLWELGSARSDTEKSSAGNRRQAVGRHLLTSKQYLPE
jgi:hypothetical protein